MTKINISINPRVRFSKVLLPSFAILKLTILRLIMFGLFCGLTTLSSCKSDDDGPICTSRGGQSNQLNILLADDKSKVVSQYEEIGFRELEFVNTIVLSQEKLITSSSGDSVDIVVRAQIPTSRSRFNTSLGSSIRLHWPAGLSGLDLPQQGLLETRVVKNSQTKKEYIELVTTTYLNPQVLKPIIAGANSKKFTLEVLIDLNFEYEEGTVVDEFKCKYSYKWVSKSLKSSFQIELEVFNQGLTLGPTINTTSLSPYQVDKNYVGTNYRFKLDAEAGSFDPIERLLVYSVSNSNWVLLDSIFNPPVQKLEIDKGILMAPPFNQQYSGETFIVKVLDTDQIEESSAIKNVFLNRVAFPYFEDKSVITDDYFRFEYNIYTPKRENFIVKWTAKLEYQPDFSFTTVKVTDKEFNSFNAFLQYTSVNQRRGIFRRESLEVELTTNLGYTIRKVFETGK